MAWMAPQRLVCTSRCFWLSIAILVLSSATASALTLQQALQGLPADTTEIRLSNKSLTGSIPDDLAVRFKRLKVLDVSLNKLEGTIPQSLGLASELTHLDLFHNLMTGRLPTSIGNWSKLQLIRLSENQFYGPLPDAVGAWKVAEQVILEHNQFSGFLPDQIGHWKKARIILLGFNNFSGTIPKTVGNWKEARQVGMGPGSLTGAIPIEVGEWRKVTKVDLFANQLSGPIPPAAGNWAEVEEVYLEDNRLSGEIPVVVGNWTKAFIIYLYGNMLTGGIPPVLGTLTGLLDLHLASNQLTGDIPPELGKLTALEALDIYDNKLTGSIPPEVGNWKNILWASFDNNQLTGPIPPEVASWSKLLEVTLFDNKLSGEVPPAIGAWSELELLDLSNNEFTGTLPSEVTKLSNVWKINLGGNRFRALPDLSNLSKLKELSAPNNAIAVVGNLPPNLQQLDLSGNELTTFPTATYNMKELEILSVSSNKIGKWPLKGVFLHRMLVNTRDTNCGRNVSEERFAWTKIRRLDVSNNPLKAKAQHFLDSLAYIPTLAALHCRNCSLKEHLWEQGEVGLADDQLSMGFLNCTGSTPTNVGFVGLTSLDLSHNKITRIDTEPSPSLMFVDFSNNNLTDLDPLWFNLQSESSVFDLKIQGNSAIRAKVRQPREPCKKSGESILLADPGSYEVQAASYECTSLCSGPTTKFTHDSSLDELALCRCRAGFGGAGKSCELCPKDSYSVFAASEELQQRRECKPCPGGSFTEGPGSTQIADCKCPAGLFLNATAGRCQRCKQWPLRATKDAGEMSAAACSCNASYSGLKEADGVCGCDDGSHLNHKSLACQKCSNAELCIWGTKIDRSVPPPQVKAGFWAEPVASTQGFTGNDIWRCTNKLTCPGGGRCAQGREGRACGLCEARMHGGPDGPCEPCSEEITPEAQRWLLAAQCACLVPLVLMLHAGLTAESGGLGLVLHLRATRVSVKQTVKHLQTVSVIGGFSVSWPPLAAYFFALLERLTIKVPTLLAIGCLQEQTSASLEMFAKWTVPIVFALAALLAMPTSWLLAKLGKQLARHCKGVRHARYLPSMKIFLMSFPDVARVLLFSITLFWSTLVANSMEILTCVPVRSGRLTVATYPHLVCNSSDSEFLILALVSVAMALLYVIVPMRVLYRAYRHSCVELAETHCEERGWYGFLFDDFRDSHLIWTLLIMAKDAVFVIIPVVLHGQGAFQLLITAALSSLHAVLVAHETPFKDRSNSLLEAWNGAMAAALCIYSVGMGYENTAGIDDVAELFENGAEDPVYRGRAVGMVLVQMVAITIPAVMMLYQLLCALERTKKFLPRKLRPASREECREWMNNFNTTTNLDLANIIEKFDDSDFHMFRTLFDRTTATVGHDFARHSASPLVQMAQATPTRLSASSEGSQGSPRSPRSPLSPRSEQSQRHPVGDVQLPIASCKDAGQEAAGSAFTAPEGEEVTVPEKNEVQVGKESPAEKAEEQDTQDVVEELRAEKERNWRVYGSASL